jgi:hypothetical protein
MTKKDILATLREQLKRVELVVEKNPGNWQQIDRYHNVADAIKFIEAMAWIE